MCNRRVFCVLSYACPLSGKYSGCSANFRRYVLVRLIFDLLRHPLRSKGLFPSLCSSDIPNQQIFPVPTVVYLALCILELLADRNSVTARKVFSYMNITDLFLGSLSHRSPRCRYRTALTVGGAMTG